MIYTVTLNPALDKTVEIPSFTTDGVNRITSIRTDPGGKGINVSKVVAALGSTSRVLGILGGRTSESPLSDRYFIRRLRNATSRMNTAFFCC